MQGIGRRTDAYDGDVVVFMALNAASRRLKYSTAPDTVSRPYRVRSETVMIRPPFSQMTMGGDARS